MRRIKAMFVGLLLLVTGCGTPESVRQTNRLNADAARWIADTSPDPGIDRAAKDIADGSLLIERKLGAPEQPLPYSAEVHEGAIVQGNKDVDAQEAIGKGISDWISTAVTKVADFVWPGLGGLLAGAFFWLRKNTQFDKLKAGVAPIIATIEKMPDVKAAVASYAGKIGAGAAVKAVVDSVAKK